MKRAHRVLNWLMVPTAGGLLVLLVLALADRPTLEPNPNRGRVGVDSATSLPAAQQLRQFLAWGDSTAWRPFTNSANPFFTLAIQPPPPPTPPAQAPATRKVDVNYRGYFQTSARVRRAVVQVADKEVIAGKGDKFLADFAVVGIELDRLIATNPAGTRVELEFRKGRSIEVPAK